MSGGEPRTSVGSHPTLIALAGLLAEHGVSRLEMTTTDPAGVAGPAIALLARHTDLPSTLAAPLSEGHTVTLAAPQLAVAITIRVAGDAVRISVDPPEHPLAAQLATQGQ